jgi:hypothetical protein
VKRFFCNIQLDLFPSSERRGSVVISQKSRKKTVDIGDRSAIFSSFPKNLGEKPFDVGDHSAVLLSFPKNIREKTVDVGDRRSVVISQKSRNKTQTR